MMGMSSSFISLLFISFIHVRKVSSLKRHLKITFLMLRKLWWLLSKLRMDKVFLEAWEEQRWRECLWRERTASPCLWCWTLEYPLNLPVGGVGSAGGAVHVFYLSQSLVGCQRFSVETHQPGEIHSKLTWQGVLNGVVFRVAEDTIHCEHQLSMLAVTRYWMKRQQELAHLVRSL